MGATKRRRKPLVGDCPTIAPYAAIPAHTYGTARYWSLEGLYRAAFAHHKEGDDHPYWTMVLRQVHPGHIMPIAVPGAKRGDKYVNAKAIATLTATYPPPPTRTPHPAARAGSEALRAYAAEEALRALRLYAELVQPDPWVGEALAHNGGIPHTAFVRLGVPEAEVAGRIAATAKAIGATGNRGRSATTTRAIAEALAWGLPDTVPGVWQFRHSLAALRGAKPAPTPRIAPEDTMPTTQPPRKGQPKAKGRAPARDAPRPTPPQPAAAGAAQYPAFTRAHAIAGAEILAGATPPPRLTAHTIATLMSNMSADKVNDALIAEGVLEMWPGRSYKKAHTSKDVPTRHYVPVGVYADLISADASGGTIPPNREVAADMLHPATLVFDGQWLPSIVGLVADHYPQTASLFAAPDPAPTPAPDPAPAPAPTELAEAGAAGHWCTEECDPDGCPSGVDPFLTLATAAGYVGCKAATFSKRRQRGTVPPADAKKPLRWRRSTLDAYLQANAS